MKKNTEEDILKINLDNNNIKIKIFLTIIYVAKIILHYNSKNITRILAIIVNFEMCIVNCNIYENRIIEYLQSML